MRNGCLLLYRRLEGAQAVISESKVFFQTPLRVQWGSLGFLKTPVSFGTCLIYSLNKTFTLFSIKLTRTSMSTHFTLNMSLFCLLGYDLLLSPALLPSHKRRLESSTLNKAGGPPLDMSALIAFLKSSYTSASQEDPLSKLYSIMIHITLLDKNFCSLIIIQY